jgi:GTPase
MPRATWQFVAEIKILFHSTTIQVRSALRPPCALATRARAAVAGGGGGACPARTARQINYQPVVHCGTVRQAAKITTMAADVLRTGDKALCHFCFMVRAARGRLSALRVFR